MRRDRSLRRLLSLGGRAPPAVGALVAGYVLLSVAAQLAGGLAGALALVPAAVLEGEVWRVVTWALLDVQPLSVLLGGMVLWWFGRDLCSAWGERRFLATWFLLSALAGLLSAVAALALPGGHPAWIGAWPVLSALTVGWGLLFPERQILFNLVVPVSGRALAWLTVGTTAFFAVFEWRASPLLYLPHFAAQGLLWLWFRGVSPRGAWQSFRLWMGQRRQRRRASHLEVVKKDREGDPPRWLN